MKRGFSEPLSTDASGRMLTQMGPGHTRHVLSKFCDATHSASSQHCFLIRRIAGIAENLCLFSFSK